MCVRVCVCVRALLAVLLSLVHIAKLKSNTFPSRQPNEPSQPSCHFAILEFRARESVKRVCVCLCVCVSVSVCLCVCLSETGIRFRRSQIITNTLSLKRAPPSILDHSPPPATLFTSSSPIHQHLRFLNVRQSPLVVLFLRVSPTVSCKLSALEKHAVAEGISSRSSSQSGKRHRVSLQQIPEFSTVSQAYHFNISVSVMSSIVAIVLSQTNT